MKIAVLDSRNLYSSIHQSFGNEFKLNYSKVSELLGAERVYVTGVYKDNVPIEFITALKHSGIEPIFSRSMYKQSFKQDEQCLVMTITVINSIESATEIIIGSQNRSLVPFVNQLICNGKKVTLYGTNMPHDLKRFDTIEVTADELLKANKEG